MIKRIRLDSKFKHRHLADVEYFQDVCRKYGYDIDPYTCALVWARHSDTCRVGWFDGWMGYVDEMDVWNVFYEYIERNEGLSKVKML